MFIHYLRVAVRNLRTHKGYAAINVLGLSIGLACSFFILLWGASETRIDRFHAKGDRLYQGLRHSAQGGEVNTLSSLPKPLADALGADYPEVKHALLMTWPQAPLLSADGRGVHEEGQYVGPAFFEMFSFPLVEGDPAAVLDRPSSIVISEAAAGRLFGSDWRSQEIVGRVLRVDQERDVTVTGVFTDMPETSTIQADFVMPIADYVAQNAWLDDWRNAGLQLFVELNGGASAEALSARLAGVITDNSGGLPDTPFLQPFEDRYLYAPYENGVQVGGRILNVRILTGASLFLLLIAAINFMNLATARAGKRSREIGVRKAIGANRGAVAAQFLLEALLLSGVAFVVALGLMAALLPAFLETTGLSVGPMLASPLILLAGLGISLLVGLLAGLYPAAYLSGFEPVTVLRGSFRQGRGTGRLRQGLVVFQFALSTLLIAGTVTVYLQVAYIQTANVGVDREQVAFSVLEGAARAQYGAYREALLQMPGIESVSSADQSPLSVGNGTPDPVWDGKSDENDTVFYFIHADTDYVETTGMELVAGRSFAREVASDSNNVVINEQAARAMGMADPVGQRLTFRDREGVVIGVVRDFHTGSFRDDIRPTFIRLVPQDAQYLFVRTAPGQTAEAVAALQTVHDRFNPDYPFDYSFLDVDYAETYAAEATLSALMLPFALVAVLVAGLGLLGLVSFTAERRRKEVGIRKTLGASVAGLVGLLARDFAVLVTVAFVIAVPVSAFVLNRWLDGFSYRIDVGVLPFVLAGGLLVVVTTVSVGGHALRAAAADPVRALRSD